ncbi:MAG: hypothetical protein AAFY65_01395 [Pseudomonadota bacterium]
MIWRALRGAWPLILGGLALIALTLVGRRNGRLTQQMKNLNRRVQKTKDMQNAAAQTPRDRQSVVERMHDGAF